MTVCPEGSRCLHRRADGSVCNEPLDPGGWHAKKCEVGGGRNDRHNRLRDWHSDHHKKVTGHTAATEQRVTAWDRLNPRTGEPELARLDIATRNPVHGRTVFIDWSITCEHSTYQPRKQARSNKDGLAAMNQVDEKRRRYPPAGGELVPMVFESNGRPSEEAASFIRSYGHALPAAERSEVVSTAWRQISRILQTGNAEMILSAIGR